MFPELTATLILLILVCLVLLILDLSISGVLALATSLPFKKCFCWGLLSLAIPPLAMLYGTLIERNCAQVKQVELHFSELPEAFDGYRIVQLSDIHSRSFEGRLKCLGRFVDKVNSLDADLIAFTGDVITLHPSELEKTAPVLSKLSARDGVVSVLGNHDYGVYSQRTDEAIELEECIAAVADKERQMGWQILMDESVTIKQSNTDGTIGSIAVIGVENTTPSPHFDSRGTLAKASEGTDGMFRILLSHDPMHWDMEVVGKDYPLTLSGHTHAIQFSLFGWCPSRYLFKQYRGLYEAASDDLASAQKLYVNIGLGETIFPARIGTPPEITLITLRR